MAAITFENADGINSTPVSALTPLPVAIVGGGTPTGATSLSAASGNVAAAAATATLPAVSAKTNYLAGFSITGAGATGASVIAVTITGLLGGTATYNMAIPAGVTLAVAPLLVNFIPPLPASAVNIAIVVSAASFGTGNTNAAAHAWGYLI